MLSHPQGTNFNPTGTPQPSENEPPFKLPPRAGIAGVMISDWARGEPLDTHNASPKL